ncbi:subtilisin-like protease [Desarmillaria tabescens]|uniref:Subtilisin-like protease n=1 Tax=Armillaria tabescens TaxID=1929756 RepID=A0AA39NBJ8_ARMTA|nr:subtilisin-like protease [Desarmillaria tabescens]KAK0462602.1 subtilisin-like protease [Desarmillaria tabescens]
MRTSFLKPSIPILFAWCSLASFPLSSVRKETNLPFAANKFIVELDSVVDITGKRSGISVHTSFYASLNERAVGFHIDKEFDAPEIFVGAALTLEAVEGVKSVRPVQTFNRPAPVFTHVVTGINDAAIPPDSQSTHILTGVDKLHAAGITGSGIKIGIFTGIDYTHPLLGGGFGPGFKVVGGYDLVGDNFDGTNSPVPDPDPLDQCQGHGTHVAGIIAADPINAYNISGVAYSSSISAYRIFGCKGYVTDDVIIDALIMGYNDGQDILTLSLGGASGWTESASSVVASRIAATGKIVTIAAGNDGSSGSWFSSGPGNGIDVISVASLDNTAIPLQNATVGGVVHDPITYFETFPFPITKALPIYAISNDTSVVDDACSALSDSTPDLSSFLVIVRRGTCPFTQKLANIAAKGATVAFIYDNGNGFAGISVGDFTATLIQAVDGEFLVSQFAAGVPVTISFPQSGGSYSYPNPAGGLISSFTSYGPTNDFFFKPAIAAPGGNILSTLPVNFGSFGVESGTSMATPFVAGCAALLLNVKGKDRSIGKTARTLFETTATLVSSSHTDGDPWQTVTQQGAGLINVYNAIHTTTIVSPGELILNDTANFQGLQQFTVQNTGKSAKSYQLSHVPAGTAITIRPGTFFPALGPVPLTSDQAKVWLSQTKFTLRPGQKKTIVASFMAPSGLDSSLLPVYSGFIQVSSGSEITHVSYMGLAASLRDQQVVDNTDFLFGVPLPLILDTNGNVQTGPINYTFANSNYPSLLFRLAFGTPLLRVDLVESDIDFQPTLNTRALDSGHFFTFPHTHNGGSFARVKIVGPLAELDFFSRNDEDPDNFGYNTIAMRSPVFANGTAIPNGSYKFLLRALKVTGDPTKEEDFESWLSPIIGIVA